MQACMQLCYCLTMHDRRLCARADGLEAPTLSYWCFEAGVAMRALGALKIRCVLLTSGTLSPLGSFAGELGLPFPLQLENPHVIARSQVPAGFPMRGASSGPSCRPLMRMLLLFCMSLCRLAMDCSLLKAESKPATCTRARCVHASRTRLTEQCDGYLIRCGWASCRWARRGQR